MVGSGGEERWVTVEVLLSSGGDHDVTLDVLSGLLPELGAQGLQLYDDVRPARILATFRTMRSPAEQAAWVAREIREAALDVAAVQGDAVEEMDWASHWKAHFHPLRFGSLWVVPSWAEPPEPGAPTLVIDPSMAFGTGLHPTTQLCLHAIVERSPCPRLLDVGTGTGILALAALKLGGAGAVGIDIDPPSVEIARENRDRNAVSPDAFSVSDAPLAQVPGTFPLVVANVLAEPLLRMARDLRPRVAPGGAVLLSGVLDHQMASVASAYEGEGLTLVEERVEGEWGLLGLEARTDGAD